MDNAIAAAAIAGMSAVLGSLTGVAGSLYTAHTQAAQSNEEHQIKRRDERKAAYLQAINLVTDWQWGRANNSPNADRDFSIPFVRSSTAVRVFCSPAAINAVDKIQIGLSHLNGANDQKSLDAAYTEISRGLDDLVVAARSDVGPRPEDQLPDVAFRHGAGPHAVADTTP
jgi:hypothetical protein